MIEIELNVEPPKHTHQSSLRIFKPNGYNRFIIARDKKGIQQQNDLIRLLTPFKPKKPLTGALKLDIEWVYSYRKTEPKKNRTGLIPCDKRPDCDNIIKNICDSLTRSGFWKDDSQVYDIHFSKYWGMTPKIKITIIEEYKNEFKTIS